MFMAKILAQAALKQNFKVTLLPSYGAEVRGGTSHCMLVIGEEEIASPFVKQADTVIALNEPSLNKFRNRIKNKGLLIINSSLVENNPKLNTNNMLFLPFSEIASKLGNVKVTNMVCLGAYISKKKLVSLNSVLACLKQSTSADKKQIFLLNEQALKEGMKLVNSRC